MSMEPSLESSEAKRISEIKEGPWIRNPDGSITFKGTSGNPQDTISLLERAGLLPTIATEEIPGTNDWNITVTGKGFIKALEACGLNIAGNESSLYYVFETGDEEHPYNALTKGEISR